MNKTTRAIAGLLFALSLESSLSRAFAQDDKKKAPEEKRQGQFRGMVFEAFNIPDYKVDAAFAQKVKEEISLLKGIANRAKDPNQKAEPLFRIGELYWLDERSTYFKNMEIYQRAMKNFMDGRSKVEPKEPKFSGKASFEIYKYIAKIAPKYPRLDEVLFLAGHQSMEINSPDAAGYFERLIREFPKSKLKIDAHMQLGDIYFSNRDLDRALANFQTVLKSDNKLHNFALYKIGWCYYNKGQTDAAMKIMQKVVASSKGIQNELELREEALKDLIIFYSDLGLIDEARRYFTSIGEPKYARKVLERLADIYYEQSRYEKAIDALQKLIAMDPYHPDLPKNHSRLIECFEKNEELERSMREMQVFIASYRQGSEWFKRNPDAAAQDYAYNRSEGFARFLAQKHHEIAQKAEGKNRAVAERYTRLALRFYEDYITLFGTHKNAAEMRFLYAQLLFKNNFYAKAADQFEWIVKNDKKSSRYKDSLVGLVDSLRGLEEAQYKQISAQLRKTPDQKANFSQYAVRLSEAYGAYIATYPNDGRVPEMMLSRAQLYYNYNQFDRAKPAFGQIIQKYPDHQASVKARHAILDMYNLQKDWENLEKIATQFLKVPSFATEENKKLLLELIQGSIFQRGKDYEDNKKYLLAAQTYERLLDRYPDSKYGDKALFNASINYLNADENDKAIETSKLFMAKYSKSELAPKLILALATNFDDRLDYAHAAEYYEILAKNDPKSKLAPDALFNAGLYREQLKQYSAAIQNYDTYLRLYPGSKDAAETAFSLALVYEKVKDYNKAIAIFKTFPKRYPREKARIVEAYYRLGDNLDKLRDYGPAETAWKNAVLFSKRNNAGVHFAAQSKFELAAPMLREFKSVKLRMPQRALTNAIQRKAELLKQLQASYLEIINLGDAEVGVAALYHIGYIYQDFSSALFNAPVPPGLNDNEQQMYQQELQNRATPIENKAIEAYENALKKAYELQVYNEWTIKTYDALTQYKRDQYPPRKGEAEIVWQRNEPFAAYISKAGFAQKPVSQGERPKVSFDDGQRLNAGSTSAFSSALQKAQNSIASNARDYQAYVVSGRAYRQIGEYDKAKNAFENAILVQPRSTEALVELGRAASEGGNGDAAIQAYQTLLQLDPDNWTTKNNLAIAYRKKGDYNRATSLIREILSSDKFHIYAINSLGLLYHDTRRFELAELTFQKGKKNNPSTAETYNNLGLTYLSMNLPSNAINEFKKAVELDPTMLSAWMNLGNIYLKHANASMAVTAYEKVLAKDAANLQANQNIGVAYLSVKEVEKARRSFLNVLELVPDYGPALLNLGIIYHQYEPDREKALEYYTRFVNSQKGKLPKNHEVFAYIKQAKMIPDPKPKTGGTP